MKTEINSALVKEYGIDAGANVVGISASADFGHAPDGFKPADVLENCRSVIVLGAAFSCEALSMNPPEYTELRNTFVTKATEMAKAIAKRITKESGYKAKAISATGGKTIDGKFCGQISLKHAAEFAGLGIITRNYLLTSPEYGNRLWLSAVLTDAELTPDEKIKIDYCENCNKCVEACPVGALNDLALFGKKECGKFFAIENKKLVIKCFRCRSVCPYRFGKIKEGTVEA